MPTRTAGLIAVVVAAMLGPSHIVMTGRARMTVVASLSGAIRRLALPECRLLLDDFTDQAGRPLTAGLAVTAESPADVLAALYFVDDDDAIQCRTDQTVAAFTAPGSRVIHVCGRRFIQFAAKTKGGEILLIHELLHALGLGENPPSSSRITNAVMNRCG